MFRHGLNTNITLNLAVLLVVAMILIDFVIIITAQRVMLRSEIDKGHLFIAGIESSLANYPEPLKRIHDRTFKGNFEKLLKEAGYACGLVLGTDDNKVFF